MVTDYVNITDHNIIACIPIYKESIQDLNKMISSFKEDQSFLKMYLMFIIDGPEESIEGLLTLLGIHNGVFQSTIAFDYLIGKIKYPIGVDTHQIDFTIIIKHKNKGKHDTHLLFFDLLKQIINKNPEFITRQQGSILMLDSDTGFHFNAVKILHATLWDKKNASVGAVTGMVFPHYHYLNPLECAQYFEYKVAHLRKVAESSLGFVICVQGAFCLYKVESLFKNKIIEHYAKPPKNAMEANNLLGEDRYLTVLLLRSGINTCCNTKGIAYTTSPKTIQSFLLQRKRWNNSFLTSLIQIIGQTFIQPSLIKRLYLVPIKILLSLELLLVILYPANWFQLIWEFSLRKALKMPPINWPILLIFSIFIILLTMISLFLKVSKHSNIWNRIAIGFTIFNAIFFPPVLYGLILFISEFTSRYIYYQLNSVTLTIGVLLISIIMGCHDQFRIMDIYCSIWRLILMPVFGILASMYAYSQFDNFSWGTRNLDLDKKSTPMIKNIGHSATHYKMILILSVIGLNLTYLSCAIFISPKFLIWIYITLSCITFLPIVITSLVSNIKPKNIYLNLSQISKNLLKSSPKNRQEEST